MTPKFLAWVSLVLISSSVMAEGIDPLRVELGRPYPLQAQFSSPDNADSRLPIRSFRVPAPSGGVFLDFEVAIDAKTKNVLSVVAKRSFEKKEDCVVAYRQLRPLVEKRFDLPARPQSNFLSATSGVYTIDLNCAFQSDSPYISLTLELSELAALKAVSERFHAQKVR